MLSWIFLILILAALVVCGTWVFTYFFGGEKVMPDRPDRETDVIQHNADALRSGNLDAIAFDVVPHGYRQEQVDALIAQLASRGQEADMPQPAAGKR